MFPIGLSTCSKVIDEALFASYRESGITEMEISTGEAAYADLPYGQITLWAKAHGVHLNSFHLPFSPFRCVDPSSTDESVRTGTVAYLGELIRKAGAMGIDKFIIHPSAEPMEESDRPARMEQSKRSLVALQAVARASGGTLCVEDLPRTCLGRDSDDIAELLAADDTLRCCFDTNHLLKEDNAAFVRRIGGKIVTLHVSDYDFVNERHWLPGEGKADFAALIEALREIGYAGPWLYEIGFAAPKTLARSRDLTCADFVRNAKELFAGQKPTRIE